jgi:hypothetical protein
VGRKVEGGKRRGLCVVVKVVVVQVAGNDATRHQMDDTKLAWRVSQPAVMDCVRVLACLTLPRWICPAFPSC